MNRAIHNPLVQFLGGALLALLVGLALFALVMRPPLPEMGLMTALMGGSGLLSVLAAALGYRSGWLARSPNIRWTLAAGSLFAGLLAFLNVWITARMMFASPHDLALATILLVFATGIAVVVGLFLSQTITRRIRQLGAAAEQVARGQLNTRLPLEGRDELTGLARSFNAMVAQLEQAEADKRANEAQRRELIAWVGHDLRTPLTSIRAIVEALADGVIEDEAARQRYLRTAQNDIAALAQLIDDLFELSQFDAGGLRLEPAPASIGDLLSDALARFSEPARRKQITLSGAAAPGLGLAWLDERLIGRVLANLLSNALRHTPPGGFVQASASAAGSLLRVTVRDSGEGIRAEDLPRVFERFYRGEKSRNRATGGAGLGLAIARRIVEAHGGAIWVENQAPGVAFTFTLPLRQAEPHMRAISEEDA